MLAGKLLNITAEQLQELCLNAASETRTLEFKERLPGKNDQAKVELCKDVAALANADGGDIVFGISEDNGHALKLSPICDEAPDIVIRRIGQILDAAIEPNITRLEYKTVNISSSSFVLIVRVPKSLITPHRVVFHATSRFVIRDMGFIREMSYFELQQAFTRVGSFPELVSITRDKAVTNMRSGALWRPLKAGPACILQMMPMATMMGLQQIDVMDTYQNYSNFMLNGWPGLSRSLNLDGPVFYSGRADESLYSYNQIRRDALMEAYTFCGSSFSKDLVIPALSLADFIRDASARFVAEAKRLEIDGPASLCVTLVGVQSHQLAIGDRYYFRTDPIGDRDIMAIPAYRIDELRSVESVDELTKPILDIVWQAFAIENCTYFDEFGSWTNPR